MLRNELKIAIRFTLLTTVLLGILYPLAVTAHRAPGASPARQTES